MSGQAKNEKPLIRALRGERLARPPFWFMRQAGRYLPEYRAVRADAGGFLDLCMNPEKAAEVTLQPIRRYGMDAAILFADILLIPHALGQPLDYREGEGPVLEPIRDAAGVARLSAENAPPHLEPVMETVARVAEALPDEVALIGFAGAPWTVATYMVEGGGSPDHRLTKRWAYSDPDSFVHLIGAIVESTIDYLAAQVEAGAEALQIFDTWAGSLAAPEFERWVVRPTHFIVQGLRARGIDVPIIGFPRGAGMQMADYLGETGVQAYGLDFATPADQARELVGGLFCLQGNLDPQLLVVGGDVMLERARAIRETLNTGPYVFNLGHGIVPETPPEHVSALSAFLRGD